MTPKQVIEIRSPSLALTAGINNYILLAEQETGTIFGDLRSQAVALLTMHWLAVNANSSNGTGNVTGSVTSEKEGDLSRSYGMQSGLTIRDADLAQTSWGLELLRLRKSCIFSTRTRMVD